MKSKKRWFLGLALVLPVALLLVVLSSLQPASADVGVAQPHRFHGTVTISTTSQPASDGTWVKAIAEGAVFPDGGAVEFGAQNPVTTTNGEYDRLLVQGEELSEDDKIAFYIYYEEGGNFEIADCREPGEAWQSPCSIAWHSGWDTELELQAKEPTPAVAYTLTVRSEGCCPITVTVDGVDTLIAADVEQDFTNIASADLEVITDTCCEFAGWSVGGTENPLHVDLTDDLVVVATCTTRGPFDLTVNKVGTGTVTLDPDPVEYDCCTWVTATADTSGYDFWVFDHWDADFDLAITDTEVITFHMDDHKVITATFVETAHEYTLEISTTACYTIEVYTDTTFYIGEVGPHDLVTFFINAFVDVTLVPTGTCCDLNEWRLDGAPQGNAVPFTFTMDANHSVVVDTNGPPFTLAVGRDPVEGGTVTVVPDQPDYGCGDWVTVTAVPTDHWDFTGWIGELSGMAEQQVFQMNEDVVATATFALETFTVTFPPVEGGEVVPEPEQPPEGYGYGMVVTLTAVPTTCYGFVEWTGLPGGVPTDTATVVITVTEEMTITPIFARDVALHNLNVYADPLAGGSVDPISGVYTCCTWITVTATADSDSGYEFAGWLGDIGAVLSTTNPISIHMLDRDLVITATFTSEVTPTDVLLVGQVGAGNFGVNVGGVTLTVRFDGPTNEAVVDVDASGLFTVTTDDIILAHDTYTVCVKEMRSLAMCQEGVAIPTIDPAVVFGDLVSGDGTNDNVINTTDFSTWITSFTGSYARKADYNGDGVVNTTDFSVWITNFTGGNTVGDPW